MTADASSDDFVTRDVLRSELDVVRAELEITRTRLESQLEVFRAELRQEMHQLESRMTRWMVATMFGGMVAAAAIATAVSS